MSFASTALDARHLATLLRGEPQIISGWVRRWSIDRLALCGVVIVVGASSYGMALGWWRDPLQALYTAAKLPLAILLTTLGNALLNGMLAPLLGLNIGFKQSLLVIFMSFTIAAAILGAVSPLMLFLVWNTPPPFALTGAVTPAYSFMQLMAVVFIAFAGVMANVRLVPLLRDLSGSSVIARRVLFAWLAGNLLLGGQICWVLRPFIGNPNIPVEFYTKHAFEGNFFEAVFGAIRHLIWP
jgi:hypothetical protein